MNQQSSYSGFSYLRKRSRSTWVTSLLSIALVLFFLGLFAGISIFGESFSRHAKSDIAMKVFLHDGVNQDRFSELETMLKGKPYIRKITYVSKEEAGEILMDKTGEDVADLMGGVNPLLASFDIQLHDKYINLDSIASIRSALTSEVLVSDVSYPVEMITRLSRNLKLFSLIFIGIGVLLLGIAFYLIFSTIKLSIYAQRMAIRSMQLIGATRSFIRRPFLSTGLVQGGLAAIIACLLLIGVGSWILHMLSGVGLEMQVVDTPVFIALLGGIVLFGLILGLSGSYFAVNKYLSSNLDELL